MARAFIIAGILLILIGLAWPWVSKLPFGRLPGDFVFGGERFRIYVPLATSVLLSIILSLIIWFLRRGS